MLNERKKMMGEIFHITSYRVWVPRASKVGRFGLPKIQLSPKVAEFVGYIGIYLTLIFRINDFLCDSWFLKYSHFLRIFVLKKPMLFS